MTRYWEKWDFVGLDIKLFKWLETVTNDEWTTDLAILLSGKNVLTLQFHIFRQPFSFCSTFTIRLHSICVLSDFS